MFIQSFNIYSLHSAQFAESLQVFWLASKWTAKKQAIPSFAEQKKKWKNDSLEIVVMVVMVATSEAHIDNWPNLGNVDSTVLQLCFFVCVLFLACRRVDT